MTNKNILAYDRLELDGSNRFFDSEGRLHVKVSNISKAVVNPYYGREIPDSESLGLDPDRVYYLLRDPEELKRAASTFNNIQLLIKHIPVNAEEPQKESIAGTVGSDAEFSHPYLKNSLCVWDQEAISLIEAERQKELSSAYRYRADMTPGTYEGVNYDGIMRDIIGNHVALVSKGRAGSDVVVADENPFSTEEQSMKQKKIKDAVLSALEKTKIAQDEDIKTIIDAVTKAMIALDEEDKKSEDEEEAKAEDQCKENAEDEDEEELNKAEDEAEEEKKAEDQSVTKAAMDAAIAKAVTETEKRVRQQSEALAVAREEVAPIVGKVAMDSAEAVYKYALDHAGVNTKGVHSSAFRSMVELVKTQNKPAKQAYAQDSKAADEMLSSMPNLQKYMKQGA